MDTVLSLVTVLAFVGIGLAALRPKTDRLICEGTCRAFTEHELEGDWATCKGCGAPRRRPERDED